MIPLPILTLAIVIVASLLATLVWLITERPTISAGLRVFLTLLTFGAILLFGKIT